MINLRQHSSLLLILLLALVLRLISINTHMLWYDESFAVLFAETGVSQMVYGTLAPVDGGAADIHPLLYYTTLNIWMSIFGQNPVTVRLWSVILGLLTVVLMYAISTRLFSKRAGLVSALIVAVAPFHVQYSQEVRMYSLMGLLLMGVMWCYLQATHKETKHRWLWWGAFGVLAGLSMHTQQLSAFYLVAIGLVPFIRRNRQDIIGMIVGAGIAFVVYLPWLVNIPSQLEKVNSYYWIVPPDGLKLLVTLRSFLNVHLDIPPPASLIALLGMLFLFLFFIIQIVMYVRKPRRSSESDKSGLLFALWLFVFPIALMWVVSQVQPVYLERGLLPSALMLYVGLGWMFTRSGLPTVIAGILGIIGLMLGAVGLYYQYTWDTFPNSPFEETADFIQENRASDDVVFHMSKLSMLPMTYYDRDLPQAYLRDVPGSSEDTLALPTQEVLNLYADVCIMEGVAGADGVWLIVFERVIDQYVAVGRTDFVDVQNWLDDNFTFEKDYQFNDLLVYHYVDGQADREQTCEG